MKSSDKRAAAFLAAALLLAAPRLSAQDASGDTLHVLRPVIHAEQDEAELCLEFDHDIDATSHGRTSFAFKLENDGKVVPLKAQNISVSGNLACVPSLEHRRDYHILVTNISGTKSEKLASPYGLGFTVPDRSPGISFADNAAGGGLGQWRDDPVVRSVNVPAAHLELYRITDPDLMSAAWRDRQQTILAPSESATFAHTHGQQVWSGDLTLSDAPNKPFEKPVTLAANVQNAPDGLYLLIARGPEIKADVKTDTSDADKEADIKPAPLAPIAATWLLRSPFHLRAARDTAGVYGFLQSGVAPKTILPQGVRLVAEDANGAILAETTSDASGVGFIGLQGDKAQAAVTLAAFAGSGDAAFLDLGSDTIAQFTSPKDTLTLQSDKTYYTPASAAVITLGAHDAEGRALAENGTTFDFVAADGPVLTSVPVPPLAADGTAHLTIAAPALPGVWQAVWRRGDGHKLAETTLRVTADAAAPRLEITADRTAVSSDLGVTLKSSTVDQHPAPYIAGRVMVAWSSPDTLRHDWKDFHFGTGSRPLGNAVPLVSFVTDERGTVSFHLNLNPPDDHAALHDATITVAADPAAGVAPPSPLTLPVKPKENIIGIKPLAEGGRFPENGFARFDVVMLDADLKRRAVDDLTYQVYEEGRSFDWYQADGRWNYKLQQQRRRIGGGSVSLGTDGEDVIELPIAAGTYRLEITDVNGVLRAAADFTAGSVAGDETAPSVPLYLTPTPAAWKPGQDIKVHFNLDKPSLVTAWIGDDRIRKVIHETMNAGNNDLTFNPGEDWRGPLSIEVRATDCGCRGQITVMRDEDQTAPKTETMKQALLPDDITMNASLPAFLTEGDVLHLPIDIGNRDGVAETLRYTFTTSPDFHVTDGAASTFALQGGETHRVLPALSATRAGDAGLKLTIIGTSHLHLERDWVIPVIANGAGLDDLTQLQIPPRQTLSWPMAEKKADKEVPHAADKNKAKEHPRGDTVLFVSATSLGDLPEKLLAALAANPFATAEIAGISEVLRLWRGTIADAGFIPDSAIMARQHDLVLRLLSRQETDGGFADLPGGIADFSSTAEALRTLAQSDLAAAKPASDRAAAWLRDRLGNTWFAEKERPDRAAAYAVLAETGRMDNASLHYFSDTSAKTTIPPLAAVQLAFAFAKIGDQPASAFWIDRAGVAKDPSLLTAVALPILAANPFFDADTLLQARDALEGGSSKTISIDNLTSFLETVWHIEDRKGARRITVDTDKRNLRGTLVVSAPAKTVALSIRNEGDGTLYVASARRFVPGASSGVMRHIYQVNGTEMSGAMPLRRGTTYLVVLEGVWANADTVLVHDDPGAALTVVGCLPPAPIEASDQLAWLKNQVLTSIQACESADGHIDVALARKDNNGASWRMAYMAKAEWAGSFAMSSAHMHAVISGHTQTETAAVLPAAQSHLTIR